MPKLETTPERSQLMAKIKSKRTKPEVMLSKALWHKGFRYHLNYEKLPGSPDIAITKYNVAIFVDGEFWHGKDYDRANYEHIHNREYWTEKIERNMRRDQENDAKLKEMGWTTLHFWGKDIEKDLEGCIETIVEFIDREEEGRE